MYAWLVEEDDGTEGVVAAIIPALGSSPVPLQSPKLRVARSLGGLATAHGAATGKRVRLARLVEAPE
jgi:hypothetical protein